MIHNSISNSKLNRIWQDLGMLTITHLHFRLRTPQSEARLSFTALTRLRALEQVLHLLRSTEDLLFEFLVRHVSA